MIILEKPYVSDFLIETIKKNNFKVLDNDDNPKVFILWGNSAKSVMKYIHNKNHLILTSAHPSPLSAYHGFFNNNHFKKANEFLKQHNRQEINWVNN